MREPVAGPASPVTPSPWLAGSPVNHAADLSRPPPQIPDHELLHPIGRGAYGLVWLARNVMGTLRAVKAVYRQDFIDPQPFEREFRGIQKFEPVSRSHDGLVDILQIGRNDTDGYFYCVMELADDAKVPPSSSGPAPHSALSTPSLYTPHTLRHDLRSQGRLPFADCLRMGLALTGALEHLHRQGLVHRDIKPSNIIFVNGRFKLADIGLVAEIDEAHSLVGTVGYLPPDGAGTPQADLYSLGKVLYEAAFGKQAAEFPQLPADLPSRPDHRRLLELNEIIATACASHAEDRYHSAGEMHADLARLERGRSIRTRRWLEAAGRLAMRTLPLALVLAVLGIVAFNLNLKEAGPSVLPGDTASIFVLPFRPTWPVNIDDPNASESLLRENLHTRITDAVIDSLALHKGVRVGPRKSGWIARDEAECRREAARTFPYVLTGKLTNPPGRIELHAILFQCRPERILWSQTFIGSTNDVIALERQVIDRVAKSLGIQATPQEVQRIEQKLSNNVAAYREWRAAMAFSAAGWARTNQTATLEALNRAWNLDRNFVEARAAGAMYVKLAAGVDQDARAVIPQAMNMYREVLEIDDTCFEALQSLLSWRLVYDWDWEVMNGDFDRLRRQYPQEHIMWALLNRCLGRTNEARLEQALAEKREPNSMALRYHGIAARFFERDYAGAFKEASRWPQLTYDNYCILDRCYIETGNYPKALEVIKKAREEYDTPELLGLLGRTYALMGDREKALEVLRDLENRSSTSYIQPYFVAWIHAGLGQTDEVLNWLDRAVQEKSPYLLHPDWGGLRTDPAWDSLRDDPRFHALLERVGLDIWPR